MYFHVSSQIYTDLLDYSILVGSDSSLSSRLTLRGSKKSPRDTAQSRRLSCLSSVSDQSPEPEPSPGPSNLLGICCSCCSDPVKALHADSCKMERLNWCSGRVLSSQEERSSEMDLLIVL